MEEDLPRWPRADGSGCSWLLTSGKPPEQGRGGCRDAGGGWLSSLVRRHAQTGAAEEEFFRLVGASTFLGSPEELTEEEGCGAEREGPIQQVAGNKENPTVSIVHSSRRKNPAEKDPRRKKRRVAMHQSPVAVLVAGGIVAGG